jgi:hypothetical protein
VQRELLEVLQKYAAVAMHDRFGKTRGSGGVQNPQRVIERHPLEGELRFLVPRQQFVPEDGVLQAARVRLLVEVRHDDGLFQGGHLLLQSRHDIRAIVVLAAVAVAVHREEYLRVYLRQAVDHTP